MNETCTTSIIISLNTHSHPACGDVSYNVTISDNVIYPDTVDSSTYTIDELQSDTLYNITVTSTYNSGSRIVYQPLRTSLPKRKSPLILHNKSIRYLNIAAHTIHKQNCDIQNICPKRFDLK